MNPTRFVLPLLAASLVVASGPAQEPAPPAAESRSMWFTALLIVQCGASDLVLNKPLLDAIAAEPSCADAVAKIAGRTDVMVSTELPAPHLAGTFQVHLAFSANTPQPSVEQQDRMVDAVVAHLRQRLDTLLFAQPSEQGKARSAELARKLEELLVRRGTLQASLDAATASSSDLAQRRAAYDQEIAAARLDVLTQERARAQVDKLRAEYSEVREQRRAAVAKFLADKAAQEKVVDQMSAAMRRGGRTGDDMADQRAKLDDLTAAVRTLTVQLEAASADVVDAQRMLTVVLEQLPAGALEQQRAQARLDALAEARKQLEDLAAVAAKERDTAARRATESERLAIEVTVTKTLLTETEGKLARLQPVRYELLRRR